MIYILENYSECVKLGEQLTERDRKCLMDFADYNSFPIMYDPEVDLLRRVDYRTNYRGSYIHVLGKNDLRETGVR